MAYNDCFRGFKEFTLLKPKCPELWAKMKVSYISIHTGLRMSNCDKESKEKRRNSSSSWDWVTTAAGGEIGKRVTIADH